MTFDAELRLGPLTRVSRRVLRTCPTEKCQSEREKKILGAKKKKKTFLGTRAAAVRSRRQRQRRQRRR